MWRSAAENILTELADIQNDKVGRFVLNTGDDVSADHCIFTIHPKEILKLSA